MSRPKITLQKETLSMKKPETRYKKRTQKDYSQSLKLQIVKEIENGFLSISQAQGNYGIQSRSTVVNWVKKFGTFSFEYTHLKQTMEKTPEQKILELEQRVKQLERQKKDAEYIADRAQKKAILFEMMVDIAEEEFNIPMRKKYNPESYEFVKKKKKSQ